jgi:hypothetical protein
MSAVINIDKVCRLCMEETPVLIPIFSEDLDNEGALLPQRIMALAEIQVNVKPLEGTVFGYDVQKCWPHEIETTPGFRETFFSMY